MNPKSTEVFAILLFAFSRRRLDQPVSKLTILIGALCACLVVLTARAETSMSTLQSLPAVGLELAPLPAEADVFALLENDILDRLRRVLEAKNVPLIGPEHVVDEPGRPVLEVTLQLAKVRGPSYLYTIDLELRETVVPVRELKSLVELDAVTWKRKTAGIANRGDTILEAMDRMADDFATEYQREN